MDFDQVRAELESLQIRCYKVDHTINILRLRTRINTDAEKIAKYNKSIEEFSKTGAELRSLAEHVNACLEICRVGQLPFGACSFLMAVKDNTEYVKLNDWTCESTGSQVANLKRGSKAFLMYRNLREVSFALLCIQTALNYFKN